jgi:DNA (cytosine-5)-methyltransferase 1
VAAQLTFGSLFAGIGGIDLGLERAGMRCSWQVEIDDYATRVLTKHWPDVPKYRDVRGVGAHNLAPVDVLAGGFPCQDISNAGKRAGITGERSGLWSEFARLIRELRPRYVLVENVTALLVRGMGTVLGDLAAIGYDAEWQCLPAAAVGAPHRRDRVWIVAYASSTGTGLEAYRSGRQGRQPADALESALLRQKDRAYCSEGYYTNSTDVADATSERLAQRQSIYRNTRKQLAAFERNCRTGAGIWSTEPDVGRVAHGVSHRMDRLRGLGNAVVPQVAEFVGLCIQAHHQNTR